jgi:hypothetical protein
LFFDNQQTPAARGDDNTGKAYGHHHHLLNLRLGVHDEWTVLRDWLVDGSSLRE